MTLQEKQMEEMREKIRRESDNKFSKIEEKMDVSQSDISLIKTKIFNGFSHSIQSTENKVNYIDAQNKVDHKDLKASIINLTGKMDKIIWAMVSVSFFVILGNVIQFFVV